MSEPKNKVDLVQCKLAVPWDIEYRMFEYCTV
jgi:hypothetical protein